MTFKTVLVQVEPGYVHAARVQAAVSVAHMFDASLFGVGAKALDEFLEPAAGYMKRPVLRELHNEIRAKLADAETLFRDTASSVDPLWRSIATHPLEAMSNSARCADLIVSDRGSETAAARNVARPGDLIMETGLPVLVAPPDADRLLGRHVVVGWKDAREARRAVTDSLPFLRRADDVLVASACAEADAPRVEAELRDVVGRLQRHGIKASHQPPCTERVDPADLLIELAERSGADLIVAGAYGRSRAREWVFGGVTRELLRRSPNFVLFSR
jgi:nucleotide-binding universal stress UspA family protein